MKPMFSRRLRQVNRAFVKSHLSQLCRVRRISSMLKSAVENQTGVPLMVHAAHRNPTAPIQYETPMVIHDTFVHEVDLFRWLLDDDYRLRAGECVCEHTGDQEIILVMVEGKANVTAAGTDWGELGERMDVFEKTPPHCLYVPNDAAWEATATTECTIAICKAPGKSGHAARRIGPDGITLTQRGEGSNTRHINNIAMENEDYCDSLLVTEVFTPAGNWSSYPSHRHDEDDYPRITYLEETYYHRLNPVYGFGIQRVYTDDLTLNETMAVHNHDVVCVPRGHHPCGTPHGFEMYYLNVMAGPRRAWRFVPAPNVEHLM